MTKLNVLFVEDFEGTRQSFKKSFNRAIKKENLDYVLTLSDSIADAEHKMKGTHFDVIISDGNLGAGASGGDFLTKVIIDSPRPVILYAASPNALEYEDSAFVLKIKKSSKSAAAVVDAIKKWDEEEIFSILHPEGKIRTEMNNSISKVLISDLGTAWSRLPKDDSALLDKTIRAIVGMGLQTVVGGQADEEEIFPGVAYQFNRPKGREYLSSGDVICVKNTNYIVLTPACDLVSGKDPVSGKERVPKAKKLLVAALNDTASFVETHGSNVVSIDAVVNPQNQAGEPSPNNRKNIEEFFRHARPKSEGRYFMLPPFADFIGGVVDYLDLTTFEYETPTQREVLLNSWVLNLRPSFSMELQSRLSRFYSRLGQPTYDQESLVSGFQQLLVESNRG